MRNLEAEDDEAEGYENHHYVERIPPPRPPPPASHRRNLPPPPPPPPRVPLPQDWILKVRDPSNNKLRMIHVSPRTMDVKSLSVCVHRALELPFEMQDAAVVGLWCEPTKTFLSLQHILSLQKPTEQEHVHSLFLREPIPEKPWWRQLSQQMTAMRLLVAVFSIYMYFYWENVIERLSSFFGVTTDYVVNQSLIGLYRNGPRWLGFWEGERLEDICTRLSHYGDSLFWRKNMVDCEILYSNRQNAFLQYACPTVYVLMFCLLVYVIAVALRRPPPPENHDAISLYHAVHTIARQFQERRFHAP